MNRISKLTTNALHAIYSLLNFLFTFLSFQKKPIELICVKESIDRKVLDSNSDYNQYYFYPFQ